MGGGGAGGGGGGGEGEQEEEYRRILHCRVISQPPQSEGTGAPMVDIDTSQKAHNANGREYTSSECT